jgi:hypothetical protein
LVSRLTEMVTPAALFTGLVKAQMAPAIRPLKIEAAAKFFSLSPDMKRMALLRRACDGQKVRAFKINRPTNTAVRERPNTSVVARSFVMTSLRVSRFYKWLTQAKLKRAARSAPAYVGSRRV